MRLVVLAIIIGFPIALVIAWAFEVTPQGIKRTDEMEDLPDSRARRSNLWIYVVVVGAFLSIALFFLGRYSASQPNSAGGTSAIPAKSIAVLPFENLSSDKNNAYFADGIQDQILTKLASVADLKVISRTSTAKYKSKPEDLKTVSQQLGVATVLEGTVQRDRDRVRVNVQLIDARADTHLWAKNYDRELKDVFEVQSEVSQEIADALRAKLSPSEAATLAVAPTRDAEAYDLFLKAEFELKQGESALSAEWLDRADASYREALKRDPNFSLAAARLAESRLTRHWFVVNLTPDELTEVKGLADRALLLAPELAEAHIALGFFHYWAHRDYEPALLEFRRAIELQPNNNRAPQAIAAIYRRQGQWERSMAEMAKCEKLDPRDAAIPANAGAAYVSLRQWNEAKRAGRRALALDPHNLIGLRTLILSLINGDGDLDAARRAVSQLPPGERISLNAVGGAISTIIDERTYFYVFERNFDAALKDWEKESTDPTERMRRLSARAAIRILAGTTASGKAESEEACALLEARIRERPNEAFAVTRLSWVYLTLGRNADALRLARQSVELLPMSRDAQSGPLFAVGQAQLQARAGEPREAVKTVRHLLSIPAGVTLSLKRLQLDPVWDPIRNDPEFQQLLAGKDHVGP